MLKGQVNHLMDELNITPRSVMEIEVACVDVELVTLSTANIDELRRLQSTYQSKVCYIFLYLVGNFLLNVFFKKAFLNVD